ncbi:hypothetical protein [Rhodoferax bucti]|uniref:hypothetical protein n=1 Tax=Rhodoferax bucti TaxID=2576305 RepID=UPI001108D5B8|nr:hypothetical protein [Rhodoferax bucti]
MPGFRPSNRQLRHAALALWLLSFVLPTLQLKGGSTEPGFVLIGMGLAYLPMAVLLLPYSALAIASLLSNALFIAEAWHPLRRTATPRNPSLGVWAVFFVVNILVGVPWAGSAMLPLHSTGLLAQPGYYCWLLSFALLGGAKLQDAPQVLPWLGGLLRRVGLMALVAAVIVGVALFAMVLMHRA